MDRTHSGTTRRQEPFEATVKIRYGHPGAEATVTPLPNDRAEVRLHAPQRAVTPGQAAVFYDGDRVAGGGWICRHGTVGAASPALAGV